MKKIVFAMALAGLMTAGGMAAARAADSQAGPGAGGGWYCPMVQTTRTAETGLTCPGYGRGMGQRGPCNVSPGHERHGGHMHQAGGQNCPWTGQSK
jgi:hypothetical protein